MKAGFLLRVAATVVVAASCGSQDLATAPEIGAYYVLTSYYGHSLPNPFQPPGADTSYGVFLGDQFHIESGNAIRWASFSGTAHVQAGGRTNYSDTVCTESWIGRYSLRADTLVTEVFEFQRPSACPSNSFAGRAAWWSSIGRRGRRSSCTPSA